MTEVAGLTVHPAAELFPMMSDDQMAALVEDIKTNGQDEPIEIDAAGNLIDGRNRAKACESLGLVPKRKIYHGTDVWQHVISQNLHRRHLTESQRAMVAAKIAVRPLGRPETASIDALNPPPTQEEASAALGVSRSSTIRAKRIINHATHELQALVSEGQSSLAAAERVSELPAEEQDEIVEKVRAGESIKKLAPRPTPKPAIDKRPAPPSKYGGNRRKHLAQLDALIVQIEGATVAFDDVTNLDKTVTTDEAARLADGLETQVKTLRKILNLIKERTA